MSYIVSTFKNPTKITSYMPTTHAGLMSPILDVMLSLAQSTLNVTWVDDNMGTTDYLVNYTGTCMFYVALLYGKILLEH